MRNYVKRNFMGNVYSSPNAICATITQSKMGEQRVRNETEKSRQHFHSRHLKGKVYFADNDGSTARRKPANTHR